jgi:hypothetical protein
MITSAGGQCKEAASIQRSRLTKSRANGNKVEYSTSTVYSSTPVGCLGGVGELRVRKQAWTLSTHKLRFIHVRAAARSCGHEHPSRDGPMWGCPARVPLCQRPGTRRNLRPPRTRFDSSLDRTGSELWVPIVDPLDLVETTHLSYLGTYRAGYCLRRFSTLGRSLIAM